MSNCKGCGAQIIWILTADGKKMPLDIEKKKIFVIDSNGYPHMMTGHESHFATCPKANKFRKKRKD